MKILILLILFFDFTNNFIFAQKDSSYINSDSTFKNVRVIPGKEYDKNSFSKIFSGEHWRSLWLTEIDAQELDLKRFAGGLTPLRKGGGLQTKSLRLKGKDGNEYKFRSINKDPWRSLPPEWQKSFYADLLQDQVSIGLPVSSLIVYPLMQEVGILSVEPKIVVMPNSNELGVFKKEFKGVLGIIELNPRAGKKGFNNFADADKVVNGFEIFEKTEKDNDEQVDQVEFLKARLMDIFLGDRDRHADQWQWAGYKKDGKRIWKPIPRDRDYAFGRYDGFFPWFSGLLAHSLVGFNYDIPQLTEITWTGRHLDRRFLNELDKPVWDSIANYLTVKLSDEVLKNAVKKMPPEMYAKEGKRLFNMLKSRRSQMKEAADDFYELYSVVVDVYGSNKREFSAIEILNEKEIELKIYKRDKETGDKKGEPFYKRKFNNDYTNEVRLHLLEGDDYAIINGDKDNDIMLRIIAGDGKDELKNKSDLKIKLYDSDKNTKINTTNGIYYNDDNVEVPKKPIEKYEPTVENRYGFWAFTPVVNYNNDDGFILGGGPNFVKFGFRSNPYLYYLQLTGAYATLEKDYDFNFYGDFNKLIHNSRVQFFLRASELDFNRYYGLGNETVRNVDSAAQNFYKALQQDIFFEPIVSVNIAKKFQLNFSGTYRYSEVLKKNNENNLIGFDQPYGFGKISGFAVSTGFTYDSRERLLSPDKGIYSYLNFSYYPNFLDYITDFSKIALEATGYFTVKTFTELTFVIKAGGENVFGNYPFYEGATVGGQKSIRGFSRERFQGDASLYGQSDLNIYLASLNLLLPTDIGITAIGDIGRVFFSGEDSKKWHSTYGAGAWLEIANTFNINFIAAFSVETTKYYLNFLFGL